MNKEKRFEIVRKTEDEVLKMLFDCHYCNMERPTGFGKTWTITDIASMGIFDNIFYVYPRNIIKISVLKDYGSKIKETNLKFLSYQKLRRIEREVGSYQILKETMLPGTVLFIFDESHFIGGKEWQNSFRLLEKEFPNAYFLGATATPLRSDGVDVSEKFFKCKMVFPYTMDNAIEDDIYKKPLYITAVFNAEKDLTEYYNVQKNSDYYVSEDDKRVQLAYLTKDMAHAVRINNGGRIIKKHVTDVYGADIDYMKFIVFFPNIEQMYSGTDTVVGWFREAYPQLETCVTFVAQDGNEEHADATRITKLKKSKGKIDLISCVDMLSYGYHVDDLTAVILLRATDSFVINNQQVGRAFSIASDNRAIIFDFVGNKARLDRNIHNYKVERNCFSKKKKGVEIDKIERNPEQLFKNTNVEAVDYTASVAEIFRNYDSLRNYRKTAVLNKLLLGVMPPWIACRELMFDSADMLLEFLKYNNSYEEFLKVSDKFRGWESKVERLVS